MPNWIKQHVGLASAAGVLVAAGIVAASVAASASSSGSPASTGAAASTSQANATVSHPYSPVMTINITKAGFTVPGPNPRPAGTATFRVSTKVAQGDYFYTFKLRGSTTISDVARWSGEVNSPNLSVHLAATHNLFKYVDYTGGLSVYPGRPATLTENLTPGTYYLYGTRGFIDTSAAVTGRHGAAVATLTAAMSSPSALNTLQVIPSQGASAGTKSPRIDGVINLVMSHGQPIFQIPARLPDNGTFLIRNAISQPAEAIFRTVAPGYTDAELQTYFDAVRAGGAPPNPLSSSPGGILTISPGNSAIVHLHFPAATYAVLSFLEDPSNGVHRAYEGLHKIIVMH